MFDYRLLNVNNSLGGEESGRCINSQVEEKVGICKQLMEVFYSGCWRVTDQEEEEEEEEEEKERKEVKMWFLLFLRSQTSQQEKTQPAGDHQEAPLHWLIHRIIII